MTWRVVLLLVLIAQSMPAIAASRDKDLDSWFDAELIPHVRRQLTTLPRFKGETVMFVVLRDNMPAPVSNALEISLRNRLLDVAIKTAGVSVGWQQGKGGTEAAPQPIDCARSDVHYYIGIELSQHPNGSDLVSVRALDLEDRLWVTGFGKTWHGHLTGSQRRATRESRTDATFQGSRDVPFSPAQMDLLAAHLAHDLSCALMRETGGDYVVDWADVDSSGADLEGTIELVSNNLANSDAVEITTDGQRVNARLHGKAHRIDESLVQYWLTVSPLDDSELTALSSSAYVLLPAKLSLLVPDPGSRTRLASFYLSKPLDLADCGGRRMVQQASLRDWRAVCSVLQVESNSNAIVFFLQHQAGHGLVRLGGAECRRRTAPVIVRTGIPIRFPVPVARTGAQSAETGDWILEPDHDTYYALVMSEARAARSIANHIDKLPMRCSDAIRLGLEGTDLKEWLARLTVLASPSPERFEWHALQVKDVL